MSCSPCATTKKRRWTEPPPDSPSRTRLPTRGETRAAPPSQGSPPTPPSQTTPRLTLLLLHKLCTRLLVIRRTESWRRTPRIATTERSNPPRKVPLDTTPSHPFTLPYPPQREHQGSPSSSPPTSLVIPSPLPSIPPPRHSPPSIILPPTEAASTSHWSRLPDLRNARERRITELDRLPLPTTPSPPPDLRAIESRPSPPACSIKAVVERNAERQLAKPDSKIPPPLRTRTLPRGNRRSVPDSSTTREDITMEDYRN